MRLFGLNITRGQPRPIEAKESATSAVMRDLPAPRWMERDYRAFSREAYQRNVVAYMAINARASSVAQVKWTVWNGETEVTAGPLVDLLARPNPMQSLHEYLQTLMGYWCLSGNRYQERVSSGGTVQEMYALRPDRMRVITGAGSVPMAYQFEIGGRKHTWDVDPVTVDSDILHEKMFHPMDDWYGMSPIEAGAYSIDVHNEAMSLSKSLLQNSARPSGAIIHNSKEGGTLSDENYNRLKAQVEDQYQGTRNAGRPMLLDGGLDWKQMGMSPKDMDSLETRFASARDVCLALKVPPLVIGIPGDNTYANYQEARQAFWEDTVVPDAQWIASGWTKWIGGGLTIKPDFDHIPAMAEKRSTQWEAINGVTFLTNNEKRELAGFAPIEGEDVLSQPQLEQFGEADAKALAYGLEAKVVPFK